MSDAINHYRTYLNAAPSDNKTGIPNNVWAMLMTVDRMLGMERQQVASNWESHVRLDEQVKRLSTKINKEE